MRVCSKCKKNCKTKECDNYRHIGIKSNTDSSIYGYVCNQCDGESLEKALGFTTKKN